MARLERRGHHNLVKKGSVIYHKVIRGPYKFLFLSFIQYNFKLDICHFIPVPYTNSIGKCSLETSQDPIECFHGIPIEDCEEACNQNSGCAAFEFGSETPYNSQCCLLRQGGKGDGDQTVSCSQKQTGILW